MVCARLSKLLKLFIIFDTLNYFWKLYQCKKKGKGPDHVCRFAVLIPRSGAHAAFLVGYLGGIIWLPKPFSSDFLFTGNLLLSCIRNICLFKDNNINVAHSIFGTCWFLGVFRRSYELIFLIESYARCLRKLC